MPRARPAAVEPCSPVVSRARTASPGSGWRSLGRAVLVVIVGAAPASVAAQATPAPRTGEVARSKSAAETVSDLRKLVEEQRRALDEQQREIDALRRRLDETMQLTLSAHYRLEELDKTAPEPTVRAAVEERLAKIEESVQQLPDVPKDVVSAGEFPGSIRIPGTEDAHVNLALLFRQIRGEPLDQPNTTLWTAGFGFGVSGRLTAPWQAEKAG
jgi:hypothetical protein